MRNVMQLLFVWLVALQIQAQEKNIITKSVTIENMIPFMVENYGSTNSAQNIVLLIETTKINFSSEESILIKQAIKYISEKLNEEDTISIVAYNALNGMILKETSVKDIKKLLNAIHNFSSKLYNTTNDGITLAYNYANEIYKENATNSVIMIRNPNGTKAIPISNLANTTAEKTSKKKSKNNLVLLTAIAVLPELLAIIKD
ncbi:MAG: hypothetical protein ACPG6B_08610 [Oceanihabitans sp.]